MPAILKIIAILALLFFLAALGFVIYLFLKHRKKFKFDRKNATWTVGFFGDEDAAIDARTAIDLAQDRKERIAAAKKAKKKK